MLNVNLENSEKSETNKVSPSATVQGRSLEKTSRLAIGSIISLILAFLSLALDSAFFFRGSVFSILRITALLFFATAVALGVIALFVIHFSNRQLKGYRYAITAIVLAAILGSLIFAGLFITWEVEKVRDEHLRTESGESTSVNLAER